MTYRLLPSVHLRHDVGPFLKFDLWHGDDAWRASFHIYHWWFGRHYWHCWFLPEWLMK